jgi:hypothetical protein
MKFEKVMKKFCKDVGVDKKTLMAMMLGRSGLEDLSIKNDFSSSRKDPFTLSRDGLNARESISVNTGQAAVMAYNNIIQSVDPEKGSAQPTGIRVRS